MNYEAINWMIACEMYGPDRVFVAPGSDGYGVPPRVFEGTLKSARRVNFWQDSALLGEMIKRFNIQVEPVFEGWVCKTDAKRGPDFYNQDVHSVLEIAACKAVRIAIADKWIDSIPAELL